MKPKTRANKLKMINETTFEIHVDGVIGLAKKTNDQWEVSPNIRDIYNPSELDRLIDAMKEEEDE